MLRKTLTQLRLLGIVSLFILESHTLLKAKLIVVFIFTSSLLAQRAGRREREPREVAFGVTPWTIIEARLDTLEEAIRKLSSQLAYFKQKQKPRNHTETVQSPQTPKINPILFMVLLPPSVR
ncbi:unnamed protein product [Aphis gossypii]|uniref:Uncharacterized protein n=1 Tax=Aphis gossypii TaxID=80765 RepID=A0A9P0IWQ4_APHGO|nr:unnamed protein product [Aphis gossypii]